MQGEIGNKFSKEEKRFLASVEIDYVPLIEMVDIIIGTNKYHPTERDYLKALKFIKYLMNKYKERLKCLEGPEPHQLNMTAEELTNWLKEMWYAGKYKEIDFGVWFDLEEES